MNSPVLLIGSGRLAKHLQHWHRLLNPPYSVTTWSRNESLETLKTHLQNHRLVWLAVSDSSLAGFYNEHLADSGAQVVHFSGAFHDDRMVSAHPLMSFSQDLYTLPDYQKIYFSLTGTHSLAEILPGFQNAFGILTSEQKPLYHALCVLTGNVPQMLWSKTLDNFRQLNIPDSAIDAYIQRTTANFVELKEKSVTGPIARGDASTIEKNIQALAPFNFLKKIYIQFAEEFKS
ncbi:MAG: DUF2520 domain-containing protein [Bdellovibrionaceae bacterium]|nr:DUF2520 domain-containing protein [Pseudobdellovibrionaceae bacterium]